MCRRNPSGSLLGAIPAHCLCMYVCLVCACVCDRNTITIALVVYSCIATTPGRTTEQTDSFPHSRESSSLATTPLKRVCCVVDVVTDDSASVAKHTDAIRAVLVGARVAQCSRDVVAVPTVVHPVQVRAYVRATRHGHCHSFKIIAVVQLVNR